MSLDKDDAKVMGISFSLIGLLVMLTMILVAYTTSRIERKVDALHLEIQELKNK